ncbi:type II secretion system protein GspG [bacterium]|nr:type II secretion system protein GspG [bacterium]
MNKKIVLTVLSLVIFIALISVIHLSKKVDTFYQYQTAQQAWIGKEIEKYKATKGTYPQTESNLTELNPDLDQNKLGMLFTDKWGNHVLYLSPGVHNKNSFDLWSYGADGKPGGEGENADITNW